MTKKDKEHEHEGKAQEEVKEAEIIPPAVAEAAATHAAVEQEEREKTDTEHKLDAATREIDRLRVFEDLFYDLVELLAGRASALPAIEKLADVLVDITSKQPTRDTTVNHIVSAIKSACRQVREFQGDLQTDMRRWLLLRKVPFNRTETEAQHEV